MARDSRQVLNAIMIVVNECMGILGIPQLDKRQRALLICVLSGMARHAGPMQTPFNVRLVNALRTEPGNKQRQALCDVLGMRLPNELHTRQRGSILVQDGRQ